MLTLFQHAFVHIFLVLSTIVEDRVSRTLISLWILLVVFGTTAPRAPLVMVPNGPILMNDQQIMSFVTGLSPHLSNTPVPPVKSQPTVHQSASGDVQVLTTSSMHTPQEVNLIAYFDLPATFHIFGSILVWCLEKWISNACWCLMLPTVKYPV